MCTQKKNHEKQIKKKEIFVYSKYFLYLCTVFYKLRVKCLRTAHTAPIANELPLLPYGGGIRIPRLRSHIVSNPQANATLSQAVPVIRGCRLRVYNC